MVAFQISPDFFPELLRVVPVQRLPFLHFSCINDQLFNFFRHEFLHNLKNVHLWHAIPFISQEVPVE
jgi:hypothetical protein